MIIFQTTSRLEVKGIDLRKTRRGQNREQKFDSKWERIVIRPGDNFEKQLTYPGE